MSPQHWTLTNLMIFLIFSKKDQIHYSCSLWGKKIQAEDLRFVKPVCEFALRLRKPSFGRLPIWKGALLPSAKQLHCWDCVPTAEAVSPLQRLCPHCGGCAAEALSPLLRLCSHSWGWVPTAEAVSPLCRLCPHCGGCGLHSAYILNLLCLC